MPVVMKKMPKTGKPRALRALLSGRPAANEVLLHNLLPVQLPHVASHLCTDLT